MSVPVTRNNIGVKTLQRMDNEDRTLGYRNWRREIAKSPYCNDIDQVEWVVNDENWIIPVALLELTRVDSNTENPNYFSAILTRFREQGQGSFAEAMGRMLNCDAYIVAYAADLSHMHLYNLSQGRGWKKFTRDEYMQWIQGLRDHKCAPNLKVMK